MNRLNWPARIAVAAVLLVIVFGGTHVLVSELTDAMTRHMLDILARRD